MYIDDEKLIGFVHNILLATKEKKLNNILNCEEKSVVVRT